MQSVALGDAQHIPARDDSNAAHECRRGWLHVITSDAIVARPNFAEQASQLIATLGPQGVFHLRTRILGGRVYVALAQRLLDQSSSSGSLLVINDRVDIALAAGVNGVQLGRGSLEPRAVRRITPQPEVGVSAHSEADVRNASDADWIIFGHVFESHSHPDEPGTGLVSLTRAVQSTSVKVIALGGISPDRVPKVLATGAYGVAVLSGIWNEDDPNNSVLHYLSKHGNASFV